MKRFLFAFLMVMLSTSVACAASTRRLTPKEIEHLKQAIVDEIYDYGYYNQFYQIGENVGTSRHWIGRIHLFIDPTYNSADGHGEVMYKLMPFGQIYRLFYIDSNGSIKLDGNPQNRFPITQPSRQTVFMDEDDVCRYIRTWAKASVDVDTEPTKEMIESASGRQKNRTGFSDWEYRQSGQDRPKK
jgi:hypothetical protein